MFLLEVGSEARAYPQSILDWHEVVNDTVGGVPVAVTWCPLAGAALAWDRRFGDGTLSLGVSGRLCNSDLVMFDRGSESLWIQATGEAAEGPLRGARLSALPLDTVSFGRAREARADLRVLSPPTGYDRPYGTYPYGDYRESRELLFPVTASSGMLHPKEEVVGVAGARERRAWPLRSLPAPGFLEDRFEGRRVRLARDEVGRIRVRDASGSTVPHARMFWFAWFAFHPDTTVFEAGPALPAFEAHGTRRRRRS